jgi:hypothetical protein
MISTATTAAIEKFTSIVKRSAQAHSKDIRMEMADATVLMAEIANVMTRLAVYENSTNIKTDSSSVTMQGGSF